jgi:hypothetical protein
MSSVERPAEDQLPGQLSDFIRKNLRAEMNLSVSEPPPAELISRLRVLCAEKDARIAELEAQVASLQGASSDVNKPR